MKSEALDAVVRAQMAAFAALVNALKTTDAISVPALLERLNGYADLSEPEQPLVAQLLRVQAGMISGEPESTQALSSILH